MRPRGAQRSQARIEFVVVKPCSRTHARPHLIDVRHREWRACHRDVCLCLSLSVILARTTLNVSRSQSVLLCSVLLVTSRWAKFKGSPNAIFPRLRCSNSVVHTHGFLIPPSLVPRFIVDSTRISLFIPASVKEARSDTRQVACAFFKTREIEISILLTCYRVRARNKNMCVLSHERLLQLIATIITTTFHTYTYVTLPCHSLTFLASNTSRLGLFWLLVDWKLWLVMMEGHRIEERHLPRDKPKISAYV